MKITAFYAVPGVLARGEKAKLCYGVENAASVQLTPPVERVWPSVARCVEIAPLKPTTYTLTAAAAAGPAASQSLTVEVGPPRTKILEVSVNSLSVKAGEEVSVCFKAENARSVEIGPGRRVRGGDPAHDCVIHRPARTTTYTVTALGPNGMRDTESVTVKVP